MHNYGIILSTSINEKIYNNKINVKYRKFVYNKKITILDFNRI